jgi:hypothetical protein
MEITKQQIDAMARQLVPVLEREIANLQRLVTNSRGSIFCDGFVHELGRHERALHAIRRDHF